MSERGNSTSITAPMHCTILPSTKAVVLIAFPLTKFSTRATGAVRLFRLGRLTDRGSAAHDFRQFLRNRCLPALVVHELQFADHRLRVVRRSLHRDHPCRLL